jgi:ribosomal protein S4
MNLINKRYKPRYKSFLRLRENITGSKKIFRLRKKKWIRIYKRYMFYKRRIKLRNYNHKISQLTRYVKRLRNNFRTELYNKQRINIFYGVLKEKYFKKILRNASSKSKILQKSLFRNREDLFISYLESRVDSIILRSGFFLSFREIRQVLSNGHVSVNNKKILTGNVIIKEGDIIRFSPPARKRIQTNIKYWFAYRFLKTRPSYLEINFSTLSIVLVSPININKIKHLFSFWLNLKTMFYRYS